MTETVNTDRNPDARLGLATTVITPSYRNDFQFVVDQCRSLDQFMQGAFEHFIIVPSNDLKLFAPLNGPHRKVISKESLVGKYGFIRLPLPAAIRIPGLINKRLHEQWWMPGAGRINGWLMQQIIKFSVTEITENETLLFIDSDTELFRDFDPASLWHDGKLHLQEHKAGSELETHTRWRATARKLMGVTADTSETAPMNYIGMMIPWRRSRLVMLQERITEVQGMDWRKAIAHNPAFSEYITYGLFCREVLGEDSGHIASDAGLYNSVWTDSGDLDEQTMIETIRPSQVALHIQSTIPLPLEKRRALLKAVSEHSCSRSS